MSEQNVLVNLIRSDGSTLCCQVEYEDNLTVSRILQKVYQSEDRTIAYRHYCCKTGRCLSCTVKVDDRVVQGCKETVAPGCELRLSVADAERLIRDLATDFGPNVTRVAPDRSLELA